VTTLTELAFGVFLAAARPVSKVISLRRTRVWRHGSAPEVDCSIAMTAVRAPILYDRDSTSTRDSSPTTCRQDGTERGVRRSLQDVSCKERVLLRTCSSKPCVSRRFPPSRLVLRRHVSCATRSRIESSIAARSFPKEAPSFGTVWIPDQCVTESQTVVSHVRTEPGAPTRRRDARTHFRPRQAVATGVAGEGLPLGSRCGGASAQPVGRVRRLSLAGSTDSRRPSRSQGPRFPDAPLGLSGRLLAARRFRPAVSRYDAPFGTSPRIASWPSGPWQEGLAFHQPFRPKAMRLLGDACSANFFEASRLVALSGRHRTRTPSRGVRTLPTHLQMQVHSLRCGCLPVAGGTHIVRAFRRPSTCLRKRVFRSFP
jgi:hypothetical protein